MPSTSKKKLGKRPAFVSQLSVPRHLEVTLTPAEILALFTTPITVIPAPGANKAIVLAADPVLVLFGGDTDYATDGNTTLNYTDGTGFALTIDVDDFFADSAGDTTNPYICRMPLLQSNTVIYAQVNQPVVISQATANPTAGNKSLRVHVWYHIIDTL